MIMAAEISHRSLSLRERAGVRVPLNPAVADLAEAL
jgi:hypothetical protein